MSATNEIMERRKEEKGLEIYKKNPPYLTRYYSTGLVDQMFCFAHELKGLFEFLDKSKMNLRLERNWTFRTIS